MSLKFLSLGFSTNISRWIRLVVNLSSVPCRVDVEVPLHQNSPKTIDYDSKIKILRSKLIPDNLIGVLDSTSDVESAFRIFKWASLQKKFRHTADSYRVMILKLGLSGNIDEMEGICQSMIGDRCPGVEKALYLLVDEFVRQNKLNEAIRVLVSMISGGYKPSIELFDVVLSSLVQEKRDLKDFMFVYKEMVKAGTTPIIDTLNYLLETLFNANMVNSALNQYRRMKKKGCSPNSRTFELLIGNLIANDRVHDAIVVLQEMFELRLDCDVRFYTCVIPLLCGEDKLEEAMKLFRMMKDSNFAPNPLICRSLIRHLCNNSLLDEAMGVLDDMIDSGVTPSDDMFENMVVGFCKSGKIDEAMKLLEDKQVVSSSAHNALLSSLCNTGRFFLAYNLLDEMSARNIADCNSWNVLIYWLCEHERFKQALEVLGRMIVASIVPNSSTYSALVLGYCKSGKHDCAMELFSHVCSTYQVLDSRSYSELIEGLCRVGRSTEAAQVFHHMANHKLPLGSSSFHVLMKSLFETRSVHEAMALRTLAISCGVSYTDETYTIILDGLSHEPKFMSVLLAQMLVGGCIISTESYVMLIKNMGSCNRLVEAAFLFNSMVDQRSLPKSEALLHLLLIFASHSQLSMISSAIDKLVSNGETLDLEIFNLLIRGFLKEGNECKSHQLLDSMLEKGWVPDSATHGLLVGCVEKNEKKLVPSDRAKKDKIGSILSEGLARF